MAIYFRVWGRLCRCEWFIIVGDIENITAWMHIEAAFEVLTITAVITPVMAFTKWSIWHRIQYRCRIENLLFVPKKLFTAAIPTLVCISEAARLTNASIRVEVHVTHPGQLSPESTVTVDDVHQSCCARGQLRVPNAIETRTRGVQACVNPDTSVKTWTIFTQSKC